MAVMLIRLIAKNPYGYLTLQFNYQWGPASRDRLKILECTEHRATIRHRGRDPANTRDACPPAMTGTEAGHYRAPTRGAPPVSPGR
ncbi:hypothetical protein Desti_4527 [Desulfomonile tiedjei DSM 6799]|uniref:Uncharacterized protein n=1 Tax=Desulfomonile tiedjei (strain ATCC 49306 / DSM 6799 / DCB-1) TaxID=706587 RepID=I4CC66_DESTA|nr:hypothetical protein Desti_4527 [Desulfomonile tiedjei DSM 6799]